MYEKADPSMELAIAPEHRRELVLDSGDHVIVAPEKPGDPPKSWIGEIWITGFNSSARVVRELIGDEKSEPLRPSNVTIY